VGLHRELGGIPLDEIGVTGHGAVEAADVAARFIGRDLQGATVAIEGFGAVGQACFRALAAKRAKVVAVSDINGAVYNPDGLDYHALVTVDPSAGKPRKLWNRDYVEGSASMARNCSDLTWTSWFRVRGLMSSLCRT
jgi:glutamate dehydrogenase (NAD(P)+)